MCNLIKMLILETSRIHEFNGSNQRTETSRKRITITEWKSRVASGTCLLARSGTLASRTCYAALGDIT